MNNRMYRNDNEFDNEENQMHHYMHVCTPMNQIHHEHHFDHDKQHHHDEHHMQEDHHHEHDQHHNDHYSDQMMFSEDYESLPMDNTDNNKHMPYGIHMHHNNMEVMPMANYAPMHGNMPMCGMHMMPMMPMMIELEEDDEEECDDKTSDVLKNIEKRNPEILKLMAMYGIPYPAARKLLKRIVKAVMHHK